MYRCVDIRVDICINKAEKWYPFPPRGILENQLCILITTGFPCYKSSVHCGRLIKLSAFTMRSFFQISLRAQHLLIDESVSTKSFPRSRRCTDPTLGDPAWLECTKKLPSSAAGSAALRYRPHSRISISVLFFSVPGERKSQFQTSRTHVHRKAR